MGGGLQSFQNVLQYLMDQICDAHRVKLLFNLLLFSQDGGPSALHHFPLVQYQNSSHLFWVVGTLLQGSPLPYRLAAGSDHTGFLAQLERRVFLLWEEFPLFSVYMWMVGGLLSSRGGEEASPSSSVSRR